MIDYIFTLLDYITHTKLFGFIPLDIIFHFGVGTAITIFLLCCKIKLRYILFMLVTLAFAKELLDYQRMVGPDLLESLKDIVITLLYPLLILLIRKAKGNKA